MYYRLIDLGMIHDEEPMFIGLEYYFRAFRDLSTCRGIGMGLGPIPFTAIIQYCNLYNIEEIEEFIYLIRRMDDKFLELEAKKDSKNGAKKLK